MRCLLSVILAVGVATAGASRAGAGENPNIVLILCDDLGYGDVGVLNPERGKIATPCIDRLASQGLLFTDAHSPSSVCTPTRYGLLTGRYSWRTKLQKGVLGTESPPLIEAGRTTIADLLQQQGYQTACFGKWHLGLELGSDRFGDPITDGPRQHGFDRFFGIAASLDMPPYAWIDDDRFTERPTVTKNFFREGLAGAEFEAVDVLPRLTQLTCDYIREHGNSAEQPYFVYVPLASPHTPIVPTAEWKNKSGLSDYADFTMQTDAAIGEIVAAVDASDQGANTLVIVTSDNGFAPAADHTVLEKQGHFPSAHWRGYKSDAWEGGHRIPLVVRGPQVAEAGTRCDQLVVLTDVFATLAEIAGATVAEDMAVDSFSFLPLLDGGAEPTRKAGAMHSVEGHFAVRQGDWKLLLCAGSGGWSEPREPQAVQQSLPPVQLYNLASDPREQQNVAEQHPELVKQLSDYLQQAIADGRTTPGSRQANDVAIKIDKSQRKPQRSQRAA